MNIIPGSSHPQFASILAQKLNYDFSPPFIKKFSDGNTFVRLASNSASTNFILQTIAGEKANDHFMELLFLLNAAQFSPNHQNHIIMPFFSYAKSDKLDGPGTSLRSQVCAQCLQVTGANSIITLDLHSPKVLDFFTIPITNLAPHSLFLSYLQTQDELIDPIIVSPDQGYQLSAQKYAQELNCPFAIGQKSRLDDQENIDKIIIEGDFAHKTVIIVDDYTTSGNTILYLAQLLKKRKAKKIIACITHCLLDNSALLKIKRSPLDLIITTNSVFRPAISPALTPKIITLDCSELFAAAITATPVHSPNP